MCVRSSQISDLIPKFLVKHVDTVQTFKNRLEWV
jgi:hypothetical protein